MRTPRVATFLRSFFLQAGFSDERRQALGFAWAIDPALRAGCAGDHVALIAARARHLASFNTNPCAAGLILGTTAALESRSLAARASALKSAAGASLAGAADAFFWGSLRPLAAALAVCAAAALWRLGIAHPLFWGVTAGLAVFNVPALAVRWIGLSRGLAEADAALVAAAALPVQVWVRRVRLAAIVLLVAAAALTVSAGLAALVPAAVAFAAGAFFSRLAGGPLRLAAGAGLLGAVAAAGGWTP